MDTITYEPILNLIKCWQDWDKSRDDFKMKKKKNCLAPLPKAVPCWVLGDCPDTPPCPKQEGKTPMRYNDNYASASINTVSPQSDTAVQRDYLLSRLARAESSKENELCKLFNMSVDNTPKTFKDLIDAIKNDKFTVNKKVQKTLDEVEEDDRDWYFGPLHGIIWDGKQPDPDGYSDSLDEKDKQYRAAKDIIMGGVYTDGLKALQDFEAWLPVGKSD